MSGNKYPVADKGSERPQRTLDHLISIKGAADGLRRVGPSLANTLAPPLILMTPLINFLTYQRYELWRPESLLSIGSFCMVGLAISGLISLRSELLRPVIIGLLLVLFLDMQFRPQFEDWISLAAEWHLTVQRQANILIVAVSVLVFLSLLLTWLIRSHLGLMISTVFGVMILSTILLPTDSIAIGQVHRDNVKNRADLPPVVHLILDAQIGPAGLPMNISGAAELRQDMETFYARFGFRLFPYAYSQYYATAQSVSNTLNGKVSARSGKYIVDSAGQLPSGPIRLQENAWFQILARRGYNIRVYQTDYIDYCSLDLTAIEYCLTVPSNSIHSLIRTRLSIGLKTSLILSTYLADISSFRIVKRLISPLGINYAFVRHAQEWLSRKPRLGAIAALSMMDKIANDLRGIKPGTAIFAHLLIPHGAYVYNADCTLRPKLDTWLSSWATVPTAPTNTPAGRETRYHLYFDQVRCAQKKLAKIFDALRATGSFADSTIVIHGDHGSRIAEHALTDKTLGDVSRADLVDLYSTLFAVRGPEFVPGSSARQESLQKLFAEIVMGRPATEMSADVFAEPFALDKVGKPLRHMPMPLLKD